METEKKPGQSKAEKEAYDQSGYSEKAMDLNVNRQQGDIQNVKKMQQGKKTPIYTSTKKEEILLEKKTA